MLKIGAVYTDKNNINYKIICICKYNDDELIVFQKTNSVKLSEEFTVYCVDNNYTPRAMKLNDFIVGFNPHKAR